MSEFVPGWGLPNGSRKYHWFEAGGMSLCHRWGFYFGRTEPAAASKGPDDCSACWKILDKRAKP